MKGFRLDEKLVESLVEDTKKKRTNLNNNVSMILSAYTSHYKYMEKLHYFWLSPDMMSKILKSQNETQLKKLANIYAKNIIKQMRFSNIEMNSHSIMDFIEGSCFLRNIPFSEKKMGNGSIKYSIFYGLGRHWNILKKFAIQTLMESTNTPVNNFSTNNDHISFIVKHSSNNNLSNNNNT